MRVLRRWLLAVSLILPLLPAPVVRAVSETLVIAQVQTGGAHSGTASQEMILIRNNASTPINVTNWCVDYISATGATTTKLTCFLSLDTLTSIMLEPAGFVLLSTTEFEVANPGFDADFEFSAGLSGTGGHVRLKDSTGQEIDRLGWGTATQAEGQPAIAPSAGQLLSRQSLSFVDTDNNSADFSSVSGSQLLSSGLYEEQVIVDECPNLSGVQQLIPDGYAKDTQGNCALDVCSNLVGLQEVVPIGYFIDVLSDTCQLVPLEDRQLVITELLPNKASYDTGLEFIELYNPHQEAISLVGYELRLGPSLTKSYAFTEGTILPGGYMSFSDSQTGIVLPNTSAFVQLVSPAGSVVSETQMYNEPKDDMAWAQLGNDWAYTNRPTPGQENLPYLIEAVNETLATTAYAPCAPGKYRNPETNRCRSIETAVSVLSPCDEDEERNPLTNRCRKVTTSTLTPCKPGQERNPVTNRCRTVTAGLEPCPTGQERNPETNRCRNIVVLSDTDVLGAVTDIPVSTKPTYSSGLLLAISFGSFIYIAYEWRYELRRVISRVFNKTAG